MSKSDSKLALGLNLLSTFIFMVNYYVVVPSSSQYCSALGAPPSFSGIVVGILPAAACLSAVAYSYATQFSCAQRARPPRGAPRRTRARRHARSLGCRATALPHRRARRQTGCRSWSPRCSAARATSSTRSRCRRARCTCCSPAACSLAWAARASSTVVTSPTTSTWNTGRRRRPRLWRSRRSAWRSGRASRPPSRRCPSPKCGACRSTT